MVPKFPSLLGFAALLATQLQPASAVDFEARCKDMAFCLTSFVWCDTKTSDGECVFPTNVFPYHEDGNSGMAGLLWSEEYNLTWSGTDPTHPVLVRWRASAAGENAPQFTWERNFTNGEKSFSFNFLELSREIDDKNKYEVQGIASELSNIISIRQPERFPDTDVSDNSGQFAILHRNAVTFMDTQRAHATEKESKKWSRAVGIGAGIGVPVAMGIAGFLGVILGKRIGRKTALGNGFIKMTSSGVE